MITNAFELPVYNNHTTKELLEWIDNLQVTPGEKQKHRFGKIEDNGLYFEILSEPDMIYPQYTRVHLISIFLPPIWQRRGLGTEVIHHLIAFCDEHNYALFVGPFVAYDDEDDTAQTPMERVLHKIGGFHPAPPGLLYRKVRHAIAVTK